MAVAAARWARELRVRGRQRVRGSRASRAGVLVIPVIVFGGHEDLFRLFLGLLRLWRFRSIASFVGVRIAFRLISYFGARGALLGLFPFSVLALMASESSGNDYT